MVIQICLESVRIFSTSSFLAFHQRLIFTSVRPWESVEVDCAGQGPTWRSDFFLETVDLGCSPWAEKFPSLNQAIHDVAFLWQKGPEIVRALCLCPTEGAFPTFCPAHNPSHDINGKDLTSECEFHLHLRLQGTLNHHTIHHFALKNLLNCVVFFHTFRTVVSFCHALFFLLGEACHLVHLVILQFQLSDELEKS